MNPARGDSAAWLRTASVILLLGMTSPCGAVVRYVKWDATGANNGTSWTDAYTDLQAALAAAVANDEIWVAVGTYKPAGLGGNRAATFSLTNGVTVYGGFAGTETDRGQRNSQTNITILSGDLNGDDAPGFTNIGENSYRVVVCSSATTMSTLDGVTIVSGNANGSSPNNRGGGVDATGSIVNVVNCTLRDNSASSGGGFYVTGSSSNVTLDRCVFLANRSTGSGGGMCATNGYQRIISCRFLGNTAATTGAGAYLSIGYPHVAQCVFSGNSALTYGGALYVSSTSPAITSCTFSRNTASTTGGGIYSGGNSPLNNCIFWGNTDSSGSGSAAQYSKGSATPSMSYSCIQGGWPYTGSNNITSDPLFLDPLGPDAIVGTTDDDLRLAVNSPCADAGKNDVDIDSYTSGTQPLPSQDILSLRRFVENLAVVDTGLPSAAITEVVDMGPHEYNGIVIEGDPLTVTEGQTATFAVSLERAPGTAVEVSSAVSSGDADITVQSGASLTFDDTNYTTPQLVTLAAAEDPDRLAGTTAVAVSSANLALLKINATEQENDFPVTLYVNAARPAGGQGHSWDDAFNDPQAALAASDIGDEIWVAAGTYKPAGPGGSRTATFQLKSQVSLYGGFAGTETIRSQRDPVANVTILSGDLNGNDGPNFTNYGENSYHVVTGSGTTAATVLDGFEISGGNANGPPGSARYGAGLYLAGGSPTVAACKLAWNLAGAGGAVYMISSSPTMRDCLFEKNTATSSGGGLYSDHPSSPKLATCVFVANTASVSGGGICASETAKLVNCRFFGNSATSGGGIHVGGFSGCASDATRLVNCIFSGNTASTRAGAIHVAGACPYLINCTISHNTTPQRYGGIGFSGGNGFIHLTNCVLWGNIDSQGSLESSQVEAGSLWHCCVQGLTGNLGGVGNIGLDPCFSDTDGPDDTIGTRDDDVRLSGGSPCIDAGRNESVTIVAKDFTDLDGDGNTDEPVPFDFKGNSRFVNDPNAPDTGTPAAEIPEIVDIGADEAAFGQQFLVIGNPVVVPEDGTASFTVALALDPGAPVDVTVSHRSGDSDITLCGGSLFAFDSGNFSTPQSVCIDAARDIDFFDGVATLAITAEGIPTFVVTAREEDDGLVRPLFVAAAAPPGGNGLSWGTAFRSLQDAIASASGSGGAVREIWVAHGTYTPAEPNGDRLSSFRLQRGLAIRGGFAGNEDPAAFNLGDRDFDINQAVLSGDLNGDDGLDFANNGENSYHVLTAVDVDTTALLDGFMITGGNAGGPSPHTLGGGLYIPDASDPTLTNCRFVRNRALVGGAIYVSNGDPLLAACLLKDNWAVEYGGGFFSDNNSSPTLTRCFFVRNSAGESGGGLYARNRELLTNCMFRGNSAGLDGGAIYVGGADGCAGAGTRLVNSILMANAAAGNGGAMLVGGSGCPRLTNCTISANSAGSANGGIGFTGGNNWAHLTHCILWGNVDSSGASESSQLAAGSINYCCVQGLTGSLGGTGNISANPLQTPDGHLSGGSPCIGIGDDTRLPLDAADLDGDGDTTERIPLDIDEGERITGGRVDLGADEFTDADADGLPDWWETAYPAATGPTGDPDADGLTNVEEYERYGSNPVAAPIYACNACDPQEQGTLLHPYGAIQTALDHAADGDTILVLQGTYSGALNKNLDFQGRSIVLRAWDGVHPSAWANASIDCAGNGRFIDPSSTRGAFVAVERFTVRNAVVAGTGGGIQSDQSRFVLKDCVVQDSSGTSKGGGVYADRSSLLVNGLTLGPGNAPGAGVLKASLVDLIGALTVNAGELEISSTWVRGPGTVSVGSSAALRVTGSVAGAAATLLESNLSATGAIVIDPGQQLIVCGSAVVDLQHTGQLTVQGKLVARDSATIRNSNVLVKQASITTAAPIQFNDIHLVDSINAGGEFYVQDNASVIDNAIVSEGDRYVDLDPDASASAHPTINGNSLRVLIETNPALNQGTLLELRARDYECEPGGSNPTCTSGARQATVTGRFGSDPAQNWVLDTLEIKAGAKLNLTNRAGFVFRTDTTHPETVYVKTLKLHSGAILNTALQALYYETLVDENDSPMQRPADPSQPLANGSRIVDEPLLGFSLGMIAMNDTTTSPFNEFDIRVRQRLRDPQDVQPTPPDLSPPLEGSITRLADAHEPVTHDGVMEMSTQADGRQAASSVAAKGSFARAGEENIVVAFEYLFMNDGTSHDAEIVVKLSDNQNVDVSNYEVARVRPPVAGLPGSVGSSVYAVFYQVVPYEDWSAHLTKLVRGTYVELELRGKGAVVRIDNFDPQVICRFECASYDGAQGVTEADYLVLLSEYGRGLAASDPKGCLDSRLSGDRQVDLNDLLSWDFLKAGNLNSCSYGLPSAAPGAPPIKPAGSAVFPSGGLVVTGKPNGAGSQKDFLYTLASDGSCTASGVLPAGGANSRGNGRLIRDRKGQVYQLHGTLGLVSLENRQTVIPPRNDLSCEGNTVYVGLTPTGGGAFVGMPVADAAFHPTDDTAVYVVPVLVRVPADGHTYRAAAKLRLSATQVGQYSVERLYGMNPYTDPMVLPNPPETSPYNVQGLREIEISRDGTRILVSSAQALNGNNWLLIYDESTGTENRVDLDALSPSLQSPIAMLAWSREDKVYMGTSAASSGNTRLFRLNLSGSTVTLDGWIDLTVMRQVTSIVENRADGSLYAVGLTFDPASLPATFSNTDAIFTQPRWAMISPAGVNWTAGQTIPSQAISGGSDLALPLSAVFAGHAMDFDNDGDVDHDDVEIFESCASGPGIPRLSGCEDKDLDRDNDVDQADFGILQRALGGATTP